MTAKSIPGFTWLHSTRVFLFFLAVTISLFSSTLDGYFRPAVIDFNVNYEKSYIVRDQYVSRDGSIVLTDVAVLYGTMDKVRCYEPSVTATGYSNTRGEVHVGLNFMDRQSGDQTKSRDPGPQEWGPWAVTMTPRDDIWGFTLRSAHKCGGTPPFEWTVYTKLGPVIEVSKLAHQGGS